MSKHTMTIFFPFCDDSMACDVVYTFKRGRPATMYQRNGDPGDPEEPAVVELVSAQPEDGVILPDVWRKRMIEWAAEYLISEGYDAAVERAQDDLEWERAR